MSLGFRMVDADSPELDIVAGLVAHLYAHENIRYDADTVRNALSGLVSEPKHGCVFLLLEGDSVVGYMVVTFGYSIEFQGIDAFLDEIFILDAYRGRGFGAQAITHAEAYCREKGIRALHLEVERDNTRAQHFYRKLGFADHDRYLLTKWISR